MTAVWRDEELELAVLRTDGGTQARKGLDAETVKRYTQAYKDGICLGQVVAFHDGTNYWLADGFHRKAARQAAGLPTISCRVTTGTSQDARWYAAGANATHGLPMSREDRESAVRLAILSRPESSNRSIAEHCGVSHPTVAWIREELSLEVENPQIRTGRDGVARTTRQRAAKQPCPTESDVDQSEESVPASTRLAIEAMLRRSPHLTDEAIAQRAGVEPALVAEIRDLLAREEEEASHPDGVDDDPEEGEEDPDKEGSEELDHHSRRAAPALEGVRDAVGVLIPISQQKRWREFLARSRKVLAACQELGQQVHDLASLPGGEVFSSVLEHRQVSGDQAEQVRNVSADLRMLVGKIKQSQPYASFCIRCVTEDGVRSAPECRSCQGRGYITQQQWNYYPPQEQQLAIVEAQGFTDGDA